MKKTTIFLLAVIILIYSCKTSNNSNTSSENIEEEVTEDITEENTENIETDNFASFVFEDIFPELTKALSPNNDMLWTIKLYASSVLGEIESEEKVLEILDMRTQILKDYTFNEMLGNYYFAMEESEDIYTYWEKVEKELNIIGFQGIYVEGMFADLDNYTFLKKEIENYLQEEARLFIKLKETEANSRGGEYPYAGLDDYAKVIKVGEELLTKYPNHDKKEEINGIIFSSLYPFVDYHSIEIGNDYREYCVGRFSIDAWPMATDISYHDEFLENYPNSKYFGVIKSIRENHSVLEVDDDNGNILPIYVIVTDEVDDYDEAESKIWEYLNKGIDIPHNLILHNGENDDRYFVAYRFYPNKALANDALILISKTNKNAKILKVDGEGNFIN